MHTLYNAKLKGDKFFIVHPKNKEGINLTCKVSIVSSIFTNKKSAMVTVYDNDSADIITIYTERDIDHENVAKSVLEMLGINYEHIEETEWIDDNNRILEIENYVNLETDEECVHRYKDGNSALVIEEEYPYVKCKICGSKIDIHSGDIIK